MNTFVEYPVQNTIEEDDLFFENLRRAEYDALDKQKQVYLDYTGGNLLAKSQLLKHQEILLSNILGNPHSINPTSQKATDLVEETRQKVLDYFQAHDYVCVFTPNASGALKIVGESYPFTCRSSFVLTSDNHNSVNGIREFCRMKLGDTHYVPMNYEDLQINRNELNLILSSVPESDANLFAFPAQSNVSGLKHDLSLISYAQEKGFDVLLDAAAFVPTSRLDLSVYKPDFVSVSFYKIFGYPTGIGCLLIRKTAFQKLRKPWFAGGTVTLVSVAAQKKFLANTNERFEDGTLNYTNLPAIKIGLDYIESIGIERITHRIRSLTIFLYKELSKLKHANGKPLVKIFGPTDFSNRGGNMIMNFFDVNGEAFSLHRIEKMTADNMISIRSGCFCNPGIDEINNLIKKEDMTEYFYSHENGDYYDMMKFLGKMRGATRVSVGIATTKADLLKFVEVVKNLVNQGV